MWLRDLLHPLEYWYNKNKELQQHGTTMFVFTDNFVEFQDLEFIKFYSDPLLHSMCGFYQNHVQVNQTPTKLYNCFIQRVESSRQSWFYFLYLKGLLKKGYVSFLLKQLTTYNSATGVELFDYIHKTYHLDQLPHFQQAYLELRNQVPYKNFPEVSDLEAYVQDSKYSLVLDTFAADDTISSHWLVTEKAIRAICSSSIPLLFVQARAVEKLQSIGFEIDHHSDIDVESWVQRQQMLLNILEHDTIDHNSHLLYNRGMHNRDVCAKLQQRYHHATYFDKFFTQVLEH